MTMIVTALHARLSRFARLGRGLRAGSSPYRWPNLRLRLRLSLQLRLRLILRLILRISMTLSLGTALTGCAWLDAQQNVLALRPTPGRPPAFSVDGAGLLPGDQRYTVPVPMAMGASIATSAMGAEPQQLAIWWLPHANPQAPTLLYLHGTFRNLYQNLSKINALREAGFAVLAVDYRGWGDSTAIKPTEATINADARQAWAELQMRQPDATRRVIFGHSMGGAVAVTLASTLKAGQDYGALALESTFTRLPDVAAAAGFWGRVVATFVTLDFNSAAKIGRIDAPILMLHGSADTTVPVALGRALRDAAPPGVRWVEVPGGTHSALHTQAAAVYQQAFADLIQRLPASTALTAAPITPKPATPP